MSLPQDGSIVKLRFIFPEKIRMLIIGAAVHINQIPESANKSHV